MTVLLKKFVGTVKNFLTQCLLHKSLISDEIESLLGVWILDKSLGWAYQELRIWLQFEYVVLQPFIVCKHVLCIPEFPVVQNRIKNRRSRLKSLNCIFYILTYICDDGFHFFFDCESVKNGRKVFDVVLVVHFGGFFKNDKLPDTRVHLLTSQFLTFPDHVNLFLKLCLIPI